MPRNPRRRVADALDHFGVGSNVDAYIAALGPSGEEHGRILQVALDELAPAPWQPRVYESPERMDELVASIKHHGILHPITVRPYRPEPGAFTLYRYEVVAGHRRLEAARRLAREEGDGRAATIPVLVKELDELQARLLTHVENLDRDDLSAWEIARSVGNIRAALADAGEPHDVRSVAERVARSAGTTSEYLQIAASVTEALLIAAGACMPDGSVDAALVHRSTKDDLLRVAKAPEAGRAAAIRALVQHLRRATMPHANRAGRPVSRKADGVKPPAAGARRPRYTYDQLRERGRFTVHLTKPFAEYNPREARTYLDDLVPAVAALGDIAAGERPVLLRQAGNGLLLYVRGDDEHSSRNTIIREALLRLLNEVPVARDSATGERQGEGSTPAEQDLVYSTTG